MGNSGRNKAVGELMKVKQVKQRRAIMRRKRSAMREKRKYRMTVCFNPLEKEMIEEGIHIQGLKSGWFVSFASFVRGHALAKAYKLNLQWQKRSKSERTRLEQEYEADYGEIEDHQEAG